jgi:hypothetical protein
MNDSEQNCLTEQHIFMFGATVHWFAQYEVLVQRVMARLAGTDLACVTVLTRTSTSARNVWLCSIFSA